MRNSKLTVLPKKILVVKPSSLGDVVHSLPFLNALRERFPKAEIHWVIAKGFEDLLTGHPMVKKIWVINKDMWKKLSQIRSSFQEIRILLKELRKERYDIVVDLQGLLRSGVITRATGSPVRIGFEEAREGSRFFYTSKIEGGKDIHAVDRYLKIAAFLGCDITEVCFPLPLSFNSELRTPNSAFSDDYAVMVPGARWKTKRWSPENFGELASLLPIKTVIVGGRGDKGIAKEILASSGSKSVSLVGNTDLKGLIEIIRGARFIVSNDSGPMHIAAALGIPVFAIFGPTDPVRTGPYGRGHTVIREEILCSPCFKKNCGDLKCMESLSVEKVYGIIKRKLVFPLSS
ncbi:MAG TPA: lipopolysaccharide heptosyltransferase II [Thermodesulfovibrionales bacterium]|nr:lipopolysaccharide heptosyltransferase II [Thermodesulfovibrionales bacterium]